MPASLPEKLLELQWATDHWDLTEGPIAEASEKQANYIVTLLKQAASSLPSAEYNAILLKVGLSVADTDDYDKLLDLHWKEASTLIGSLKAAIGPGAGLVGEASPAQLKFIWKLMDQKDWGSVVALFNGLGFAAPGAKSGLDKLGISKAQASKMIDSLQDMPAKSSVMQPTQEPAGVVQAEKIEELIIVKGISNSTVKKIAKKYGIGLFAGNIKVNPSDMTADEADAAIKELQKVSGDEPADLALKKKLDDLLYAKGINYPEVLKIAQSIGIYPIGGQYSVPTMGKKAALDAIKKLQAFSPTSAKPAGAGHLSQIEELIIQKGAGSSAVGKVLKKHDIDIFGGNVEFPPGFGWDAALAVIKGLQAIKPMKATYSGGQKVSGDGPASNGERKQVFDLYMTKGGALNDKVTKLLKPHGMKGPYTTPEDLPLALTSTLAATLIKQLKKLKMRRATKQQVGMALALMSQLGPAKWKQSDLSKKWPPKELRAASMMKRDSIVLKALITDLKKLLKQKW